MRQVVLRETAGIANLSERELFEKAGYSVIYEDTGARKTIFDDYDTVEHWRRVGDFKRVFLKFDGLNGDRASDLALSLEELHPRLFDGFAPAARVIKQAETSEDLAQAAVSGRRLLEHTADYLFSPQEAELNGREVKAANYKNRLLAYIAQAISRQTSPDASVLTRLGREADRLVVLFNSGLHAKTTRTDIEGAFRDLVLWLSEVLALSPEEARRPYLAYSDSIVAFFKEVVGPATEDNS